MLLKFVTADVDDLGMVLTNFYLILTWNMKAIHYLLILTDIENYYKHYRQRLVNVDECCQNLVQLMVMLCECYLKQVTRGNNIVADAWAGASNPHPHSNPHPKLKLMQKYLKRSFSHISTQ